MDPKLPRGLRNCNPGNIRRSADKWQGLRAEQNDTEFFQFESATWGIRAMARILIRYQDDYDLNTIRTILHRWAPTNENHTENYVSFVADYMMAHPDDRLDLQTHQDLSALVEAMILFENGSMPYNDAQIDKGLVLAGVEPPPRPSKTMKAAAAGSVALTGLGAAEGASALTPAVEAVRSLEPVLPVLQYIAGLSPEVKVMAVLVALGMVGWIVYRRWDDRRRGLR